MAVARNKELRGPRNAQKRQTRVRPLLYNANAKRKRSLLGRRLKKGRVGASVSHFVTRARALAMLQVSLKDFRRLCILKGVFPREPPTKFQGAGKTYYSAKDVAFLQHEPLLSKFREHKTFMKRVKRLMGRHEHDQAKRALEAFPKTFSLDHLVKERYPTFEAALGDLDDALVLVHLFAWLPAQPGVSNQEHATTCQRLTKEWAFLVSKTKALRKVFCSIKGMYFQAEFRGIPITWMVPHKFSPHIPRHDVDFRVMKTFLQFYETLLGFVMFKLYAEDLGSSYPPRIVAQEDEVGGFLSSVVAEGKGHQQQRQHQQPVGGGGAAAVPPTVSNRALQAAAAAAAQRALKEQVHGQAEAAEEEEHDDERKGEEDDEGDDSNAFEEDETRRLLRENEKATKHLTALFRNMVFFLSREVPYEVMELCVNAFGGQVVAAATSTVGHAMDEVLSDPHITHVITDRPGWKMDGLLNKEFVQPQWVFDCINAGMLLPVSQYRPEKPLPPHLSPFVDNDRVGYRPARADEIERLRAARAGGGGTEALLEASGELAPSSGNKEDVEEEDVQKEEDVRKEEDVQNEEEEDVQKEDDDEEEEDEEFDPDVVFKAGAKGHLGSKAAATAAAEKQKQPSASDFVESAAWKGPMPGFFFRRGALGTGYYRDHGASAPVTKLNPDKVIKSYAKQDREKEEEQAKEMRTILMPKKARKLYDHMQQGIQRRKESVEKIKEKRRRLEEEQ